MRAKKQTYIKWFIGSAIILPLFFMIGSAGLQAASDIDHSKNHHTSDKSVEKIEMGQYQETEKKISHKQIVSLTNQFMDLLVQEIDKTNKVVHFASKGELLDEFEKVTTRKIASKYVSFYFKEKANGLYVVPTETPPWFNGNNDYDMIRVEDNMIKVVQHNKTDLYGAYTVEIEFTYDNKWKITNIAYK